jgi:2-(1,2-epoxy-1,2-dihydrophenyl)acetyl-CoA isomerase
MSMIKEERVGTTAVVTLNQPARRNALAMPMREQLIDAFERIEADTTVRAVVVTGADGTFCSGGDISGMNAVDFAFGRERFRLTHKLVRLMVESAKPYVAAVEGWAAGAGLGMAICCDTVVAAADARFVSPFGKLGLVPDFALVHTLPRRVGEGPARQIFLRGAPFGADHALKIGLVDEVVPVGTALERALAIAGEFAEAAPIPLAMVKNYLAVGLAEALDWERNTQATMFLTADHAEGRDAFLAKRKPNFTGR